MKRPSAGLRPSWLLPAIAAAAVSACTSPDDGTDQVSSLTGTITGTILDTNGSPVVGATVRYTGSGADDATLSATTNDIGQFEMPGVTVSGVAGAAVNDANGPITLAVIPPTGYMGATINVSPQAQATGSVGGGTVFIDDFNIGVGSIKLPALNTTLVGVLRDASSGAPLPATSLRLDFKGVEFDQDGSQTGVASTYDSGGNRVTTSGDDGRFTFSNVYADACVQLSAPGLAITAISGSAPACATSGTSSDPKAVNLATTTGEGDTIDLANVSASRNVSGDTLAPFVTSVEGVIDANASPAPLESSVTQTLRVHFSESLQGALIDASDVSVAVGSPPVAVAVDSVTLEGGSTVVIRTVNPLPANTLLTISLLRSEFKDGSGNAAADGSLVAFDSNNGQYVVLSLQTFGASNGIADAPTVSQIRSQAVLGDPAFALTNALVDTVDATTTSIRSALTPEGASIAYTSTPTLEQLNAPTAASALTALLRSAVPADARVVDAGIARVSVTAPANASDFAVWVERTGQKVAMLFFPVATGPGNPQNVSTYGDGATYVIAPGGAASFDLLIRSANPGAIALQPGDVLKVASRNSAGALGGIASQTLEDISRPTVGAQLAGGVSGGATPTVLFPITPQAVDIDDTTSGYGADNWRGSSELQGLSSATLRSSTFANSLESPTGKQAIGDATGTSAFVAVAPPLGIVVSEPIEYTGTAPALVNIGTALTNYAPSNNVLAEDGSTTSLFTFKPAATFALATEAATATATIDLSASIRDLRGLAPDAGTRAVVQVRDAMPPLMSLGFFDGAFFVFRFNEPMQKAGAISLVTCGATIDLSLATVTQSDASTFRVPLSVVSAQTASPTLCFTLPAYAESAYSGGNLGGLTGVTPSPTPGHGIVLYSTVADAAGNTWHNWEARNLGIGAPYFAMADIRP